MSDEDVKFNLEELESKLNTVQCMIDQMTHYQDSFLIDDYGVVTLLINETSFHIKADYKNFHDNCKSKMELLFKGKLKNVPENKKYIDYHIALKEHVMNYTMPLGVVELFNIKFKKGCFLEEGFYDFIVTHIGSGKTVLAKSFSIETLKLMGVKIPLNKKIKPINVGIDELITMFYNIVDHDICNHGTMSENMLYHIFHHLQNEYGIYKLEIPKEPVFNLDNILLNNLEWEIEDMTKIPIHVNDDKEYFSYIQGHYDRSLDQFVFCKGNHYLIKSTFPLAYAGINYEFLNLKLEIKLKPNSNNTKEFYLSVIPKEFFENSKYV